MIAEFEEKTYEQYFNVELANATDVFFPIGQSCEGWLGADAFGFSQNHRLWRYLGHRFSFVPPFDGIELREIAEVMNREIGRELDNIPRMKCNLLFQYKRPEFLDNPRCGEWIHWNKPYYRYSLYERQQNLLLHIHSNFGSDVFVSYAAPAIWDVNELVRIHKNREVIRFSNFCKASDLENHDKNTYVSEGTFSIACSEPERIENRAFIEELNSLNSNENSNESNRDFVKRFANRIIALYSEGFYFSEGLNNLNKSYSDISRYELLYSFLVMRNFRQMTGIQWLIKL